MTPREHKVRPGTTWSMLGPFVAAFALFAMVPLISSLLMAFHRSSGTAGWSFAGTTNFRFLLRERLFWWSVLNTTMFTVAFLLLEVPLCLAIAAGLRSGYARMRSVVRFALLCPYFIGPVYASVLFGAMLDSRYGLVNRILSAVLRHQVQIDFLTDPRLALVSMLLVALWMSVGFGSLYLAAAMQAIGPELYDAARVDGAGAWRCFWHITVPSVRPMLGFLIIVGTIQSFQLFELPYVLFGGPGPSSAGMTVVMYLYGTGFEAGDFGYASAVGWAIVVILGMVMLMQYLLLRRLFANRPGVMAR
jgi:ABC-type sugar transport system permease subunit